MSVDTEDEGGPDPVGEPAYRPPTVAAGAALVGAVVATAAAAGGSLVGAAVGSLGLVLVAVGLVRGWRRTTTLGAGLGFAGVLLAGLGRAGILPVLLGAVGAAVAYDAGRYAVALGEQMRADAPTRRAELLHVGATLAVAAGAAAVGFLGYVAGAGGRPATALVALLLAALFLVWALR